MIVHGRAGRAGRLSLIGTVSQKHPNLREYDACQTVDIVTCTVYNGRPDCDNVIDSAGTPPIFGACACQRRLPLPRAELAFLDPWPARQRSFSKRLPTTVLTAAPLRSAPKRGT
jgi:hypothetical protein